MARIGLIYQNQHFPYIFEAANKLGHEIVYFPSAVESVITKQDSVIAIEYIDIFEDQQAAIDKVLKAVKAYAIEGIITLRDEAVPFTAMINSRLNFPGIGSRAAINARSKSIMRKKFQDRGVSSPISMEVTIEGALKAIEDGHVKYPLIVKPSSGFGSMGVVLTKNDLDLRAAYERVKQLNAEKLSKLATCIESRIDGILVEQFIGGAEYIVDSFSYSGCHHILSIAYKGIPEGPYFEEPFHLAGKVLSDDLVASVVAETSVALDSLGITSGPSHTEIKIEDGRVYIIEVGARIGGSGICHYLVEQSTEINFAELVFDWCTGKQPKLPASTSPEPKACASNYNIRVGDGGVFSKICGLETVFSSPQAFRFLPVMQEGGVVKPYPDFCGFPGFIQGKHPDVDSGLSFIDFLDKEIFVEYQTI